MSTDQKSLMEAMENQRRSNLSGFYNNIADNHSINAAAAEVDRQASLKEIESKRSKEKDPTQIDLDVDLYSSYAQETFRLPKFPGLTCKHTRGTVIIEPLYLLPGPLPEAGVISDYGFGEIPITSRRGKIRFEVIIDANKIPDDFLIDIDNHFPWYNSPMSNISNFLRDITGCREAHKSNPTLLPNISHADKSKLAPFEVVHSMPTQNNLGCRQARFFFFCNTDELGHPELRRKIKFLAEYFHAPQFWDPISSLIECTEKVKEALREIRNSYPNDRHNLISEHRVTQTKLVLVKHLKTIIQQHLTDGENATNIKPIDDAVSINCGHNPILINILKFARVFYDLDLTSQYLADVYESLGNSQINSRQSSSLSTLQYSRTEDRKYQTELQSQHRVKHVHPGEDFPGVEFFEQAIDILNKCISSTHDSDRELHEKLCFQLAMIHKTIALHTNHRINYPQRPSKMKKHADKAVQIFMNAGKGVYMHAVACFDMAYGSNFGDNLDNESLRLAGEAFTSRDFKRFQNMNDKRELEVLRANQAVSNEIASRVDILEVENKKLRDSIEQLMSRVAKLEGTSIMHNAEIDQANISLTPNSSRVTASTDASSTNNDQKQNMQEATVHGPNPSFTPQLQLHVSAASNSNNTASNLTQNSASISGVAFKNGSPGVQDK